MAEGLSAPLAAPASPSSAASSHERAPESAAPDTRVSRTEEQLLEIAKKRLYPNYRPAAFVLSVGKGVELFDSAGRRYLDMAAGVAVCTLGHAHPSVRVDYEVLPACLSIQQALEQGSFHLPPSCIVRGDVQATLDGAPVQLRGEVQIGGQDHFYLETQASWVQIDSEGVVQIVASTQHPTETQIIVARVLGLAAHRVVCRSLRMGGGVGGKETQGLRRSRQNP